MTLGGVSGLNAVLARINSIENNFSAMGVSVYCAKKPSQSVQASQPKDFQTVLNSRIKEAEENEIPEVSQKENEIEETPEVTLDDEIEEIKETKSLPFNLKDKINLKSKSANIDEIIETFANKYDVDSDFIRAIIKQESNFNEKATSKKGAMGLMQLMPSTAKSLGIEDAYNPWENVEGGTKHIKNLLIHYNGDKELALAAYNAGMGAVKKYGGIPPYKETNNYVNSIMSQYNKTKGVQL